MRVQLPPRLPNFAEVVEMAVSPVSEAGPGNRVRVRVPPSAPIFALVVELADAPVSKTGG